MLGSVNADSLELRQALEVADWRRRVAELYAAARSAADPATGWLRWRAGREALFAAHPQSPLPGNRRTAAHLPQYFPYDPALRVLATVEPMRAEPITLPSSSETALDAARVGWADFALGEHGHRLTLYWLNDYAGGLFVSFRDTTSGVETYGGGRYVLDTAKGADLGMDGDRLVLDFNFAYPPSCSYDERWSCPLPPRENWLTVAVRAGERNPGSQQAP